MSAVVAHLVASIVPASAAMAAARASDGAVAAWLAGARHAVHPTLTRRAVICVLADHGVVATGAELGADHPTAAAAQAIARGEAAVARAAASAGATLVLLDAGVASPGAMPDAAIRVAHTSSGDLASGAALTPIEVVASIEAGVAITTALAEAGLDVLALGGLGAGADLAAAAVIAALTGASAELAVVDGRALVASGLATLPPHPTALDVLAAVGGHDLAVACGVILAAAAMYVPIVVDGVTALGAALVATHLAPAARDYLACAHAGGGAAAAAARAALDLAPMLSVGLGHGEGTAAALVLPVLAAATGTAAASS